MSTFLATRAVRDNWTECSKSQKIKERNLCLAFGEIKKIYFTIFYKNKPIRIKIIYEIEPKVLITETERQLDRSRDAISHIGINEGWAKGDGRFVYQNGK